MPKFPGVPAIVYDGNAFAVMGAVRKAMKQNGATKEDVDAYMEEATKGDYDNLLIVSSDYVDIQTPDMAEQLDEFDEEDSSWIKDPGNPLDDNWDSELDEFRRLSELSTFEDSEEADDYDEWEDIDDSALHLLGED